MKNNKTIWFEVLTPKQAMLFIAIGKKLQEQGFSVHFTTRDHDFIHDIFRFEGIQPQSFGGYGGKTLEGKLLASAKRVLEITEHIIDFAEKPVAAISFSSPDASRVAFGLGIPLLLLNDTAHSKPVAKLTFALAKYLFTPSCIPKKTFAALGANPEKIRQYQGVDEVEYIAGENFQTFLTQRKKHAQDKEFYCVFRPEESFASYMKDKDSKPYLEIIEEIINCYPNKIIVLPRYPAQKEIILEKFEGQVVIPTNGFHFIDLLAGAQLVITGGGTMARESALMGIPSITYFWRHLEPQKFLEERGFPSYSIQTIKEAKRTIKSICQKKEYSWQNTLPLLKKLQKPSDVVIPTMKKDKQLGELF
jgi:hypothetical protein